MRQVLQTGRSCWSIADVEDSGVLVDGRDYYLSFWKQVRAARRYIWISGWQFDSEAQLVRGDDVRGLEGPFGFLALLDHLCRRNPALHVNILAWDFNVAYAFERERLQQWLFEWSSSDRLQFEFDAHHPLGASQHQKFTVVDGRVAFVGGMDVCANRWDERHHPPEHPLRREPHGRSYGPYHDVAAFVAGPAARTLAALFRERWYLATGRELTIPEVERPAPRQFEPTIQLPATRVGFSRTRGRMLSPPDETIREIRHLYEDAIRSAQRVFYMENQYFTSQVIYQALADRMRTHGGGLQIVVVLPRRPEAVKEGLALGMRQARILDSLQTIAARRGHRVGVFYPASRADDGRDVPAYVHAKVFSVDDRLLCVGSANATNRSLGLDTELNATWEASDGERALTEAIRRARVELMADHCGGGIDRSELERVAGLVDRLEQHARTERGRLRIHPKDSVFDESELLQWLVPKEFYFDPERATFEENVWEALSTASHGPFANGISMLRRWLENRE